MDSNETAVRCAAFLIVRFLDSQIGQAADDVRESIELARDCVAQSFKLTDPQNEKAAADVVGNTTLLGLIENISSVKDKVAELKTKGNDLMREGKFDEAIRCYSDAIKYAPNNAILYCNRAAARSRLEQFDQAISDCRTAISYDPNYAKAWGRLGTSLAARGAHIEAVEAFKKAAEIEPDVPAWKEGIEKEKAAMSGGSPGGAGMGANPFGAPPPNLLMNLMQSPQMMQMAQQMMSDPNMGRMMQNMMSGAGGGPGGMPPNMDGIMQMAQNFAAQMENQNPELINRLRNQYGPGQGDQGGQDGQQPPQGPPM